jgi:hypothetical protein
VDNSQNNPGNANLPNGEQKDAIQENGVPGPLPENGGPGVAGAVWHNREHLPHFERVKSSQQSLPLCKN